jgi:hypothetical protein
MFETWTLAVLALMNRWSATSWFVPTRRHRREAEARLVVGAGATSTAVLRAARHAALDLGATQLVDEVEQLAGWHRVDLVPVIAKPLPDALDVHALTPSETEVLAYLTTSGWTGSAEA